MWLCVVQVVPSLGYGMIWYDKVVCMGSIRSHCLWVNEGFGRPADGTCEATTLAFGPAKQDE